MIHSYNIFKSIVLESVSINILVVFMLKALVQGKRKKKKRKRGTFMNQGPLIKPDIFTFYDLCTPYIVILSSLL